MLVIYTGRVFSATTSLSCDTGDRGGCIQLKAARLWRTAVY